MRDIDAELQKMWNSAESDPAHLQRIPRGVFDEVKEKLKEKFNITTGQIPALIVEQLQKVDRHEREIAQNDARWLELAKSWSTGLGNISAVLRSMTSRK